MPNESSRTATHVCLLIVLGLILAWPVLMHGAPDLGNDTTEHMLWAKNFAVQFWQGELYPRWFADANAGLGSPAFFFYPPLPSYVAALFWPLVKDHDPYGRLIDGYGLAVGLLLSGITAYFWLRSLADGKSALLGAAVYLLAPYHMAINMYNRAASAEFWLFAWLPLVLLATDGIVRKRKWGFLGLATAYALSILSHPTVAMVFGAIPVAYVLIFSEGDRRWKNFLVAVAALALGVALTAALLVPALMDQAKTYASQQTAGYADYRNWWLFNIRDQIAETGSQATGLPLLLGYKVRVLAIALSSLGFALALVWLMRIARAPEEKLRMAWFYFGVTVVSFFLMLEQSALIWRLIPLLKFLELPSRLITMLSITAAAMVALAAPYLFERRVRLLTLAAGLIVFGWMAADGWSARWAYSLWRHIPADRAAWFQKMLDTGKEEFAWSWPIGTQPDKVFDFPAFSTFITQNPPRSLSLTSAASGASVGTASIESWSPRHVVLHVDTPEDSRLMVTHFYYPGWRGHVEGTQAALSASASQPNGFIQLDVPKGGYDLTLDLEKEQPERLGLGISFAAAALAACLAAWTALRPRA
jgi:hypothetical protein